MDLDVTPLPGTTGDLRIAGLTRLWYIYCTYCAVYLQMSTLYCPHSTLTHRDTHVSDLQILDITVAHHCARVSRGKKGRRGSALGCAVLPDRHTVQLCTVCTVQYNIPYVHTVIVRTVPYMRRTYLQSDSVRQTETHRSPISHMRHLLQCILYQDEHTTVP